MRSFEKHEPVTIIDTDSPFYLWAGPIEKVFTDDELTVRYVVKASYQGQGIFGTLLLSMRRNQLARGLPKEE